MSFERRNLQRIDYKILHETGEKVNKAQNKSPISKLSQQLSNLQFKDMDSSNDQPMKQCDESQSIHMNENDQDLIQLESKFITTIGTIMVM